MAKRTQKAKDKTEEDLCAHEVHTNPDAQKVSAKGKVAGITKKQIETKSPARWAYERLILYIQNFEEQLNNEYEVAMGFAGAEAGVMRIEGMGYFDPDIVTFYGTDEDGLRTQLVQHVSQLNVMLRAVPITEEESEPNRIGFRLAEDLDESAPAVP